MSGYPFFEPQDDPPDLPIIPVDRDTFDSVVTKHALTIEIDTDAGAMVVELNGLVFAASLSEVAS